MTVYTSVVGYYGFHYCSADTVDLPDDVTLEPAGNNIKMFRAEGYTPYRVSGVVARNFDLSSRLVWIKNDQ